MLANQDQEIATLKIPPHSLEAEQATLGGVFMSKEAVYEILFLNEEDFYRKEHRVIYNAICDLVDKNSKWDIVTVAELLDSRHLLDEAGGMRTLATLAENTPSASNIKAYAEIVKKRSLLRQLLATTTEINDYVFTPEGRTASEILDLAAEKVFALTNKEISKEIESTSSMVNKALEDIDNRCRHKGSLFGLSTGFTDIDKRLQGLAPADLIIVAGRPSMGKTSFAMNIGEHNAIDQKKSVVVFSMEMQKTALINRMISARARIPFGKIRAGDLNDDDWKKISKVSSEISESNLIIDDSSALTHSQIRSRLRKLQRKQGLDLVIVDYLQLMRTNNDKENRATQIAEISAGLKNIAKDFNVPVIALSQLNRSLESRVDKRPVMSDLRESGAIEQDADVITLLIVTGKQAR